MNALTTLPQVIIELDGRALDRQTALALAMVRVHQSLSQPTLCELTFSGTPGNMESLAQLAPGGDLSVRVGRQDQTLFVGQVTALEHVYEAGRAGLLRLRGYDLLHRLRKRQSVKAHVQVTAADIARDLVADLGLRVEAAEPGPLWQHLIQHRQSDYELLIDVTERCGLYLAVRDDILHLMTLEGTGAAIALQLGRELLDARIEVNADQSCGTVTTVGWNVLEVQKHEGRATVPRQGYELRVAVSAEGVGGNGTRDLLDETAPDDSHADSLAQAELDRRSAADVVLWATAEGDTRLRPGTPVDITGVHPSVAGRYVLTDVTHTIDSQQGYVTEISSEPPRPHPRPRSTVATYGSVSQINDPTSKGRIKVTLPTYGNVETDWMGVVSVGAGKGKGLIAMPAVGDSVLLLLFHEDPAQGVVVGGVYGADGPPDSGVDGNKTQRYSFVTSGGQRIRLDDDKKTLRVENSAGSVIELAPGKVRLHAATDLDIDAPGHRIRIRGKAIDFESA